MSFNSQEKLLLKCSVHGTPTTTLTGATIGFFVGFAAVSLFGPTAGYLKDKLDLSPLAVSWLVAAPALSGSLLRIPFAAWVDTSGGRKPFLVLLGMSILGMIGLLLVVIQFEALQAVTNLYPILIGLGVLVGCGIASFSVGISQVAYWFPQKDQGRALAIFAGAGNLGPGLVSLLLPFSVRDLGLPTTYLLWLAMLLCGVGFYVVVVDNAPYFQLREQGVSPEQARMDASTSYGQELFPVGSTLKSLQKAAASWKTWALVIVYFASFGGLLGLTSWLPTYWTDLHGVAATTAGGLTALYSLGASLIRIPGGSISDRLGGELTLAVSLLVMALGALLLAFSDQFGAAIAGEALLACSMGISNAAVFKLVPQEVPEAVGGAAGWVGGLGAFGGFVIPPMMAAIVQSSGHSGYMTGFFVFVGLSMLALAATLALYSAKRNLQINVQGKP